MESVRLENTSKISKSNHQLWPQVPLPHVFLNTSRDADMLGSPFQCSMKNSSRPFPLILSHDSRRISREGRLFALYFNTSFISCCTFWVQVILGIPTESIYQNLLKQANPGAKPTHNWYLLSVDMDSQIITKKQKIPSRFMTKFCTI